MASMKQGAKPPAPVDVEAYLDGIPTETADTLRLLRAAIRAAAPQAQEVISYGVPTYRQNGPLVSFAATPKHCAFYVMSPGPIAAMKKELLAYDTAPSAIRFPSAMPLPEALVTALVKARLVENGAGK